MTIARITYKTKKTGATPEDIVKAHFKAFTDALLKDQKETPAQFTGEGRDGRTPFDRTGELVGGLFFKPATRAAIKVGILGTIRAPLSRFASRRVRDRFLDYVHKLWRERGLGWSKGGI